MGAACSRHSKVTQIKVAPRPQIERSYDTDELFMNFGRPKSYNHRTAKAHATSNDDNTDVTSISSLNMEQTTENVKTIDKAETSVNHRITETADKR